MPLIDTDKTLLIRCKCHGHVLEITYDNYWLDEGVEPDFNISVWNQTPYPFSFSNRIKLIWDLILGKNLSGDDVIIEKSDAQAIVDFLNKRIGEYITLSKQQNKSKENGK